MYYDILIGPFYNSNPQNDETYGLQWHFTSSQLMWK